MDGSQLSALLSVSLTIVFLCRSKRKTSNLSLLSPGARLCGRREYHESTISADYGSRLLPSARLPVRGDADESHAPFTRSYKKTPPYRSASPGNKLSAQDSNATNRPSLLTDGEILGSSAGVPSSATSTRTEPPSC